MNTLNIPSFHRTLKNFKGFDKKTKIGRITLPGRSSIPVYTNEFWTSKQRQANSLHEVSYRACYKPQLPAFFIDHFTNELDTVYDPFSGRGTTVIEAALRGRKVIANDINPLSRMLSEPRLQIPQLHTISERLHRIPKKHRKITTDLSMFYHPKTLQELNALKHYLNSTSSSDEVDRWIRMVATNRLTGHSRGFFSVYTLPPNQAVSAAQQKQINVKRNQVPDYRDVHDIILRKSKQLMRDVDDDLRDKLSRIHSSARFLTRDARKTREIRGGTVHLTVTSPPFLDIVQYADDNWLRCWFNDIDATAVGHHITMARSIEQWNHVMQDVFHELFRITRRGGIVAFEVGEIRNRTVRLEEHVILLGLRSGFDCIAVMINEQQFTKTANIWGIKNNRIGTNSNRIVIFQKK